MNLVLGFILALVPIIWLVIALCVLKWPSSWSCVSSLAICAILALIFFKMPVIDCLSAMLEGACFGLWPIILVIIAAMFTYNLTLKTGAMDIIKQMITSVSADKRVLAILIGWCFAGFMEAMAGFGTAVAIPASMLVGLGFAPLPTAVICLLSNAAPTVFGSIGIPTVTLANVTGLNPLALSALTVIQLAPYILFVPFLMVAIIGGGWKAIKGVGGLCLVAGLSFLIPEYVIGCFLGAELPVVAGSVISLICCYLYARKDKDKPIPAEYDMRASLPEAQPLDGKKAFTAWLPFILIFIFLLLISKLIPPLYNVLSSVKTSVQFYTGDNPATITFSWIATPGVVIFLAAIIGGIAQKASGSDMAEVLGATFKQMTPTIITIISVLAMAKVMGYAGMISAIAAMCVAVVGTFYPYIAPLFGAIGAFITGSGTSSEVLFGKLQVETATAVGASPIWIAAANSAGAGLGKVLSPQCISIAASAVGNEPGLESKMLSKTAKYVLWMLVLACIITGVGSYFVAA
ncbi:MAG: L-lactate permease [Eubacteriaceae bacterium]|jgi:lactate permease